MIHFILVVKAIVVRMLGSRVRISQGSQTKELIMRNTYIIPISFIIDLQLESVISSSTRRTYSLKNRPINEYRCNGRCKIWHSCLDREPNKRCYDKEV